MKAVYYLQVEVDPLKDLPDLRNVLSECTGLKVEYFDPLLEQQRLIFEHGVTQVISPDYLEYLGTPRDDKEKLIGTLQRFLDNIITNNNLFIIDGYIFPKNHDRDYIDLLTSVLEKYIPKLKHLTFITRFDFNQSLQSDIFKKINDLNSNISTELKLTNSFHDRFWVSSENGRGAFIGTSLNGLGKKYCLIDYISTDDVSHIFRELKTENILH